MEKAGFIDRYRKTLLIILGNIIALLILVSAKGQSTEGFIYGKVYTYRQVYQGQIRWGREETFWSDMFNAEKTNDTYRQSFVEQDGGQDDFWQTLIGALAAFGTTSATQSMNLPRNLEILHHHQQGSFPNHPATKKRPGIGIEWSWDE